MAHHKSAIKRHIQSLKRQERNRFYISTMKTFIKRTREALTGENKEQATTILRSTTSFIQKVASKGIIHPNKASRLVSRLSGAFNKRFEA